MVLVHNRYRYYGVGSMNFVSESIGRIYSALTFSELKAEWRSIWLDDKWFSITTHQQEQIEHAVALQMMAHRWGD